MKRILNSLLISLVILSTFGAAASATPKKHSKKKPAAVTQEATAAPGQAIPGPEVERDRKQSDPDTGTVVPKPTPVSFGPPTEMVLKRADSKRFDLRALPRTPPIQQERAELPEPAFNPVTIQGTTPPLEQSLRFGPPAATAQAPAPNNVFEGLDRFNWGAGSPPDTNGDVGPNNYIQTVNTSIGVYRKSDGFQEAAFTFNTLMSQGHFGNLCDTNNFGDPVVLYDTFEDRWIITDFAFLTDISGNVLAPSFQCFAVSMTGDPVSGGWNFYSIQISDALNDYPKFGIWPDGLYMSSNMFTFGASSAFKTARVWAFNKAQMYAGSPTVKVVTFDIGGGDFTVIPSNARLQTGTPPPGRPNLFISTELFLNAVTVYKFHVDWNSISLSTLTGPDTPLAATLWPSANVANAAQPGTTTILDVLQIRAMVQNQYTNFGGTESLWVPHTVRRQNTSGFAAPRWYQANVTGGTVAPNLVQATTWDPDGANVINRFMPSLALDRAGNMAMGYSTSSATVFPSIKYAGRLAADPVNTFSQTEQTFFTGTASQTGVTNPPSTTRWGDYSGMSLDPNGCIFWYTNEYANPADQTFNHRWLTKFGSFGPFPGCVPAGAGGTVSGTVTATVGGAPISGATVQLGARSATSDGSGNYSFTGIPAGTYPSMTANDPGYAPASASPIVVTDAGTTTQNFSLAATPASACLTDTTQADFLTGVFAGVDLNTSPGDVTLSKAPAVDQSNTAGTSTGTGFGTPNWTGQTFIPAVTGLLARVDIPLFCNGCTGTTPNLTLSVRATSGGLPTGADLASATIPGFSNGSATTNLSVIFGSPATLTSGTQYAMILRPAANPSVGGYFWIRSSPSTYANGSRVTSADSGATWTADTTRDFNFTTYMQIGYNPAGNLVSSPKDSNPSGGLTSIWSTFSWNASVPANTSLQFQLAGSNNVNGPFNFVGPDGTAGTFFTTSPVQLSPQFYNFRFLEYKAFLATTDPNATPTLSDATACVNDVDCSTTVATITPTPAAVCSSSTGDTASGPAGMTSYSWGIANGTITSATNTQNIIYTAGASGSVTLSLTVVAPNGCIVSGSAPVTINPIPPAPTITPGGPTTFTYPGNVTLTSSSADTYQWYLDTGSGPNAIGAATNQAYIASVSGGYTVVITVNGCISAPSAPVSVVVNKATPVVTATGGTFTYNGTPQAGSGTATGGAGESLTVTLTYTGTGATTYGPSATAPTLVGTYSVVAHTDGDANNNAGDSAPAALTITMANPVIIATGGTFTYDGNPHAGSGSATGGGGEVLTVTLTYNGTGSTTYGPTATAPSLAGTYTVTAHTPGDANNNAGDSSATALTINKFNTLMAAFGGTVTYTGTPHAGSGQALGGAGEHLPVTLTYQGISGTTYGPSATPPTDFGVYLVTAHTVGDANNNAEDSLPNALRINKATATIVVTAYCAHFDGSAHTATGTATGVLGESLTGLDLSGTTHTAAGTYLGDAWTFSGSLDYSGANSTVDDSIVNAVITAPVSATTGTTGNVASVVNAGAGATYTWGITGGSITAGTGTNSITFTAGGVGTLTLNVTVTTSTSCSDAKSANTVVLPLVTVTSVSPTHGTATGDTLVTINGTSFASGATVTFGGTPATSVVVASSIKITARTPVHANGSVNVTVTNTDTSTGTLTSGYLYQTQVFDPNGDGVITSADIFFLVNYLFLGGPAPHGASGLLSGDANGDGVVDSADIFYIVNYLFLGGQKPNSPSATPGVVHGTAAAQQIGGSITLGTPVIRGGHYIVPVIMTANENSIVPQSMALRAHFDTEGTMGDVTVRRAGAAQSAGAVFEIDRRLGNDLSYLVSYDPHNGGLVLGASRSAVVAEIEIASIQGNVSISIDPSLTMLSDQSGMVTATVGNGRLQVNGTTIGSGTSPRPRTPGNEVN
ncbi:MAG TPA: carboxypeptidase regulatory-like domain-containing protein [Thermoanaerobaculia bacterium]|jgi:hypothetical protein|nr:carboxypeptidase regulatory-like domain-containing protein [Thermoanaerobaculia bacterium]